MQTSSELTSKCLGSLKDGSHSTQPTITPSSALPSAISLSSIYERPDRHELLYQLLGERDETVNISHKVMPAWADHVRFVESQPYEAWYFIGDEPFGACYLTKQNEIGIFIFKEHQRKGYGIRAIDALIDKHGHRRYLANISSRNAPSISLFRKLGFNHAQHTYALTC